MNGKELAQALTSGKHVYGTLIVSPSPFWVPTVASLGLDFVFIDTEHIPLDREKLSWMCQSYRAVNLAPLVRIPSPDPFSASMVLDGGAAGVIAPYIESAGQVRALAGAVKHRPLKGKRLEEWLGSASAVEPELSDYLTRRNAAQVLIVNIESVPAVEALDDILSVDELDAVLVGPHDLSCSLGIPEQYDHPRFREAVETIFRQARRRGKGAGIHMIYPAGFEQEILWARQEANLILHSADLIAVKETLAREFAHIKTALGELPTSDDHNSFNV